MNESAPLSREIEHAYGPDVHLVDDTYLSALLARIGSPETDHRDLPRLVRAAYRGLLAAAVHGSFPRTEAPLATRMTETYPGATVTSPRVDPLTKVVIADVMRAGIVPAQVCFEELCDVLEPDGVRLDHLVLSRRAGSDGHVAKVDLSGQKIGGSVAGSLLLIPDPMGATGSTVVRTVEHYLEHFGRPARTLVLSLMITPEFLRTLTDKLENWTVFAARLDRGLSPADVLETAPGTHWDRERGLNENDYIIPGAGGMGELLNNSWC